MTTISSLIAKVDSLDLASQARRQTTFSPQVNSDQLIMADWSTMLRRILGLYPSSRRRVL